MCAPLNVLIVLLCVVVGASLVFWSFVVFSPSLLSLYFTLFTTMHHYEKKNEKKKKIYCFLLLFFPLSSWLCVTGAWLGAGFGGRGSWLGCG